MSEHQLVDESPESFFAFPEGVQPTPTEAASGEQFSAEQPNAGSDEIQADISSEQVRLASIMAYIPFLCFIPLINMRSNREVYFHARQGIILFFIELAAVLFSIDKIADFVFRGVLVAAIAAAVSGIYFALQGKNYRLPIIHKLADRSHL